MKKMLIVNKCDDCTYYENNMYHGECCWNIKVCNLINEYERIPKKIKGKLNSKFNRTIPKWCPLDDYEEQL